VVGLTEASGVTGAELGPFVVGLGEHSRCWFEEGTAGEMSMGVGEVCGEQVWGRWDWERGVFGVEEEAVGEATEAA
jgi:hypothetical protein